tara:strand:- start:170228 stop:171412 length:1185 start_codon:yes stop_codon:yes gene_type:complete
MNGTFLLARRYLWHHRVRSAVLVGCLTLMFLLPIGLQFFSTHLEARLTERASATPLVVGSAGSELELALHALYFRGQPSRETTVAESNRISESDLAKSIPMLVRFKAEGWPIVGTSSDYLRFRNLKVAKGHSWNRRGDCLLGATVAKQLSLDLDDGLMTEPENVFELDGSFPLRMRVVGLLAETGSPDDNAVFVELETAWIIAGIGHGHASSRKNRLPDVSSNGKTFGKTDVPEHDAALIEFTEITEENASSFHFHGDRNNFPLTAILAIPHDEESETLLLGRYLADDDPAQVIRPVEVIGELLAIVMRIRQLFELAFAAMAIVTAAMLILFVVLAVQIRQREFATMFRIGCGRFMIFRLVGAELLILFTISGLVTVLITGAFICVAPRLSLLA